MDTELSVSTEMESRKETKDTERHCFQMKSRNLQDIYNARNYTLLIHFLSPERTVVLLKYPQHCVDPIWDSRMSVEALNQQWNCPCFARMRNKAQSWSSLLTVIQLSQQLSEHNLCFPNPKPTAIPGISLQSLKCGTVSSPYQITPIQSFSS